MFGPNYLINKKKELKKTKNTIKVSKFDLICGYNSVYGVRVPLRYFMKRLKTVPEISNMEEQTNTHV